MMNNSNKKLTLSTSLPSKLLPELLPKSDVPKLILTLFAMEHLQSTTLLIQSIYFSQLVNKPSLQSTPMTTLALTWTSTPESKFWLEESQYTSLSNHLVETPAHKLLIFNSVALFRESKGFQRLCIKTFQLEIHHVSFIHRLLSIYEWLPNVCILWITLVGWTVTRQKLSKEKIGLTTAHDRWSLLRFQGILASHHCWRDVCFSRWLGASYWSW